MGERTLSREDRRRKRRDRKERKRTAGLHKPLIRNPKESVHNGNDRNDN